MDEKQLQALFDAMGTQLGLDDYKSFKSNIYSDPKFRKAFFDEASQDLDLGDYNSFDNSFKKKVGGTVSQEPSPTPKVSPSVSILKEFPNQRAVSESTAIPGLKDQMAATEFAQKGKPISTVLESAKSTIDNTLQNSDKILTRIIRENRVGEFDKQRKSTPTLDAFVNPAAETAKRELLVNSIVTPEELESKKSTVMSDDTAAREVLSRAAKENPNVAKSAYIIDAEARIKENEKIAPKVLNNISLIENGELSYDIKSGKLQKPEGVIKSTIRGLQERKKQIDDYDFLAGTKNNDAIISQLEADRKSFDPDEPVAVPSGAASEFSQMVGMEGIPMIKSAAAGIITGAIPGAQVAAPYVAAFVTSPEYFKRSYSSGFRQAYYNLREQGKSEQEALETARKQAESEGVYGAIEGAASSFIGARVGFKPTPIVASKSLKDVAKNVILTGKNFVTDNLPEGFADAGVAGSLQMAKNIEAINNGVDIDLFDGVADNVAGELSFTVGMGLLTKAGSTAINANTYKTVLSAISKQSKQNIDSKLGEMIVDGQITPQQADETAKRIEAFKSVSSQIPDEVEDDASRAEIVSKIEEKNKLETKLKSTNPVFHQEIKDKIKDIDQQILNTYNNATQESKQQEGLPEGGLVQPTRIEAGQPQEGQGEGGQREGEVTPADVSNRPIGSEGQIESITINKDALTSNTITEVDRLKNAEIGPDDGVTLNMDGTKYEGGGLIVPIGSINTTQEELTPELIANFAEENKGKLSSDQTFKFGLYKFPNSNQVSIDLNIVTDPKNKDIALEFGKMAGQESLFDLSTFSNVPTGADGQNPIVFNDDQIKEIGKAFEEGRMPNVFGDRPIETALSSAIQNVEKSLKKSNVKVSVVDSATDTEEAKAARGNQGLFMSNDGTIIIDKSKLANEIEAGVVVWHEASHPVMNIIRNTNKPLYDKMVSGMKKAGSQNRAVQRAINWAQREYEGQEVMDDESIVEVLARISEGAIDIKDLKPGFKQTIIDFINSIAKSLGIDPILSDTDIQQFKNKATEIVDALTTGKDIAEVVGEENVLDYGASIGEPTQTRVPERRGEKVVYDVEKYPLSFVSKNDLIDINSLLKDISDNNQKVWFWTADQLGRGMYYDNVIEGEHYLDAGPSFALDPKNRDKGVIWATGKGEKWVNDKIANSDYIFIISGSPQKSKLFNKRVAEITFNRIKKAVGEEGSWDKFKSEVLGVSKIGKINDILNKYNSFEELLASPERKELLIQFDAQKEKKGTPLKALLEKYGALVDYNDLRDGFYKDNDFKLNDIMLVLKPTGYGGKSIHSTYENDILGEVVGVPDSKINAFDVMPDEFKAKYTPGMSRTEQSQAVAPYGAGIREVQASVGNRGDIYNKELPDNLINSIRTSLRKKAPDSFTLDLLDQLQAAKKDNSLVIDPEVDNFLSSGITLNDIGSILIDDEVFENARQVKNYFNNIGDLGILSRVQPSVGKRTDLDLGAGKEKTRALAKRYEGLATSTVANIEDEAIKYFERTNKQTRDAVLEFMDGKSNSDLADLVVSNPDIDDVSLVWMAAEVAKNLTKEIEQAKGDTALVNQLSEKQARIYNQFAKKATSLGQAVQAFVAFSNDPNATKFMLNKIIKQLKDKGAKNISQDQIDEISDRLNDVSKAAEGLPKDEAIIKLSHYLAGIAPVNGFEILQSIWYAKILSGVTTQSKNIFANLFNTSFELLSASTNEALKNKSLMPYMYAIKGLGGGFAKGAVKGLDILKTGVKKQDEGKYFRENALETFSWGKTKLGKAGKVLDFPLFIGVSPKSLRMVGRALSAADAVFSSANQEAMANMLAWAQASKEGKTNPTLNNFKRANEILGNTKKTIGDAKSKALSEGYKPGTTTYKRRVIELVDQSRPKQITARGEDFGQRVTLNFEPEGFTRPIYDMVVAAQQKAPVLKMWIPFTRIVANLSEQMINYSPVGFYRAISGKRNPFGPNKDVLTNEERGELAIKAAMGLTALGILSQVVGGDDDDWFDITANGTGDMRKNYELQKGEWRPYTITLKNGEKINYADWPIRGLLAGIGAIKDAQKYSETETDFADKLTIGALGFTTSMYESSLMKGLADFIDIFRPSRGKYDGIGDGLKKWAAQQAKSVLISNFTQQGLKMIDEYQGDPIKEAKGAEIIYRDIPIINDGLNPIIDVFGDPVKPTTSERLLPYFSVSDDKKDKLIKFLNENKIFVGVPAKINIIDLNTEEEVPMTDKQYYDYKKLYGQKLKSYLYEYLDEYKGEDVETIKTYVQSLKDAANAEAEAELFYE